MVGPVVPVAVGPAFELAVGLERDGIGIVGGQGTVVVNDDLELPSVSVEVMVMLVVLFDDEDAGRQREQQHEHVKGLVDETSSYSQQADDAIRAIEAGGSL